MRISSLDRIAKIKADMEGARDVYKQVPISKQDGPQTFRSGSLLLSRRVIPLSTNILLSI